MTSPYYNESHHHLRSVVRDYWDKHVIPYAEDWERAGEVPREVVKDFARRGFLLPGLPRKYRGDQPLPGNIPDEKWDLFHSIILMEESARCSYSGVAWGMNGGNGIGCPPISNFGTEEQKQEYLPRVCRGEIRFCLGITEPEAGSDVAGIRTTATLSLDKTHYIVNGAKKWITNGLWADYVTTAVRTGGTGINGISLLIIPLNAPGVLRRRIQNSGVHASGSTYIGFSDVKVPVRNLIGSENQGFKMIMANFNPERLGLTVGALRLARTCYEEALNHALTRKTFGKLLIENQIIRSKFAEMLRGIESCHAWIERITYQMQNQANATKNPQIGAQLALAKVQAGKVLEMCCREAQQVFGGLGVSKEGKGRVVEQISRDLRIYIVGGGSQEIMDDLGIRLILSTGKL